MRTQIGIRKSLEFILLGTSEKVRYEIITEACNIKVVVYKNHAIGSSYSVGSIGEHCALI
jgi:hypothetical protein